MTRRNLIGGLAAAAAAKTKPWKPKLGILGNFSEDNLDFAVKEGFTSMGMWANPKTVLDCTNVSSQTVDRVRAAMKRSGLRFTVLGNTQNLDAQVQEIVRVYTEQYFPLCEKHKARSYRPDAGAR